MKRLSLFLLALALVSGSSFAQWSQVPAAWTEIQIAPGDITSVTITTTSPLTGGSACTTGACAFTLGLGVVPATLGGTGQSSFTIGDVLYASSTTAISKLGIGTAGQCLLVSGGLPAWGSCASGGSTFTNVTVNGTGGNGYIDLTQQASDPSAPAAATARLWFDTATGEPYFTETGPSKFKIFSELGTIPIANGGTNATTAATARTQLGLVIGTNVFTQRTLTGTANKIDVTNGSGVSGNPTFTIPDAVTLVTPTITGVTTYAAGSTQAVTQPTSDGTSTGPKTCSYNSGYSSSAIGDAVYLDSSATWQKTDADASATTYSGMVGIALEVKASGAALCVALPGSMVYAAAAFPTFTVGGQIYLSQTAGAVTQTAPSAAGSAVVRIGWAINADMLFLSPPSIPVLQ